MRARDVMTTDVLTVTPETSIADAAKLMLDNHISGVPVVDEFGQLAGILTEGDLMRRAELETGKRPWWLALASSPEKRAAAYVKAHGLKAKDVMTKNVVTIDEHETLDRIAMVFEEHGIKRAPNARDFTHRRYRQNGVVTRPSGPRTEPSRKCAPRSSTRSA